MQTRMCMVLTVRLGFLILPLVLNPGIGTAADHGWRAGVARADITPQQRIWLAGYASRKEPPSGTLHALWAKAIWIEDATKQQVVIVSLDLIGDNFGRELADRIRRRASNEIAVPTDRVVFNFSHTHSGPVSRLNDGATVTYNLDTAQETMVRAYTRQLEDRLVDLIVEAGRSKQPVSLGYGLASAAFAANRRTKHNPHGPVDHSVPVLKVADPEGNLVAVLFGYACHTATLTGDHNRYSGDYAGFAQLELERQHPGAVAAFMMGCGGDANPNPRGTVALAEQHGKSLAAAVERALMTAEPLRGPLAVQLDRVDIPFVVPPTKVGLSERQKSSNVYQQRLAAILSRRLDEGATLIESYPFPIHAVHFGNDLTIICLAGETCVDYALRLKREVTRKTLWVAGYCNEVFAYIPSERVLAEGGYEAGGAMPYFGIHGPFRPGLEDKIIGLARRLAGGNGGISPPSERAEK